MKISIRSVVCLVVFALCLPGADGRDKKDAKKDMPRVVVAVPLGVPAGAKTKVTIRGLKLDGATDVRCGDSPTVARVLKKGKAPASNKQDPNKIGDSFVDVELDVPADSPPAELSLVIVTPAGETAPHRLLVDSKAIPGEKEPNNGFRQAQPIEVPGIVAGAISPAQDVDVFRLEGKQGQRLVLEVRAARLGSPLDSTLTLYDANGQVVAANDDFGDSTDSRLDVTLPRDGAFFVSVADAHDQGGPAYVYRLHVELAK